MIDNQELVQLIKRITTTVQLDSYENSDIVVQNENCRLSLLKLNTGYFMIIRCLKCVVGNNLFSLVIHLEEQMVGTSKIENNLYYTTERDSIIIDSTEYKYTIEDDFSIQTAFSTEVYQYYNMAHLLNYTGIDTSINIRNISNANCTIKELNKLYDSLLRKGRKLNDNK